jgi:hypothetical protein
MSRVGRQLAGSANGRSYPWERREVPHCSASNNRVHLPGGSVTALARNPMMMNHHLMPPGPRRTSPAGDANVRSHDTPSGNFV